MDDSTDNIYFSSGSRISSSGQPSTSDENILPHILASLSCEAQFPYLGAGENAQNISVQFTGRTTRLNSDILQRRISFDHESSAMAVPPVAYPESSQRTTSHALSPYATDASRFNDFSSCDLATLQIADAPPHGTHPLRRGSWPSHSQMGCSTWMQSPPKTARSSTSEPPESTSDESYQDSDADEVTQMSPMMSQFQVDASRNVDLPQHHIYHTQALQPSVMTFQLSVDDPGNRQTLRRTLDMSTAADEPGVTHAPPSSTFPSSTSISFAGARHQGPGMRLQHDSEKQKYRMLGPSPSSDPFPSHSLANARVGDQRASGSKQPKKSKMHQCPQCKKLFPRPSGLSTHMNSHSGARPFKCLVANCEKRFAVRSNAKRHLRTHGINPSSPDALSMPNFTVGFEEPMVTQVHDAGGRPSRYRWITHNPPPHESEWGRQGSLSSAVAGGSRAGLTFQTSMSSGTSSTLSTSSDDDSELVASSSVTDAQQYPGQSEYGGTDEYPGSYPNYGTPPRRG